MCASIKVYSDRHACISDVECTVRTSLTVDMCFPIHTSITIDTCFAVHTSISVDICFLVHTSITVDMCIPVQFCTAIQNWRCIPWLKLRRRFQKKGAGELLHSVLNKVRDGSTAHD